MPSCSSIGILGCWPELGIRMGGRRERSNSGASAMQSSVVWSSDLVCLAFCVIPPARVELGGVEEGWRASQGHKQNRRT